MIECPDANLVKRTWVYVNYPETFGIAKCKCGCPDEASWSEYKDRLWCHCCETDFEPEHWGLFDGPISIELSELTGVDFDRIDLTRHVYQKCVLTNDAIEYVDLLTSKEIDARRKELQGKSQAFMEMGGFHKEGNRLVLDNKPDKRTGTVSKMD